MRPRQYRTKDRNVDGPYNATSEDQYWFSKCCCLKPGCRKQINYKITFPPINNPSSTRSWPLWLNNLQFYPDFQGKSPGTSEFPRLQLNTQRNDNNFLTIIVSNHVRCYLRHCVVMSTCEILVNLATCPVFLETTRPVRRHSHKPDP